MDNNKKYLQYLSYFLNNKSSFYNELDVKEVMECGVDEKYALALLLASFFNLDVNDNKEDALFFNEYIYPSLKNENIEEYIDNPYYKNIHLPNYKKDKWEIKLDSFKPYELFVRDDMIKDFKGKILPQIGFFNEKYYYNSIYQDDRLWMSITPNEINTMKKDINDAFGVVCTYGLGMGYFACMCAIKKDVSKVIIVEKDKEVIELFNKIIFPFFNEYKEKIEIINTDAYDYGKNIENVDYVFVDLWHDVSDGKELYLKFKNIEKQNIEYRYWIEKTIKLYL